MQFSKFPGEDFVPKAMAYNWLARRLYVAGTGDGEVFQVWSIDDADGVGGVKSLLHSVNKSVEQAQMTINPFTG